MSSPTSKEAPAELRDKECPDAPAASDGQDIEKSIETNEQTTPPIDGNTVGWDGDDDPNDPYNWPTWQKVTNCATISFLTFVTPLASSIFAPGVPLLMRDFQSTNQELAAFVVSVYILGFAFGPLIVAPLSETYGRSPVYHACNVGFIAFNIACAKAPTLATLVVFRFFAGAFGSCPLTNGGGSIADMISPEKRAAAMASFSMGPLIGPILGPVAGGALSDAKGWRWVFWVISIVAGFAALLMALTMRETFAPVLLARKVKKLQKETGNQLLRSKLDDGLSSRERFSRAIVRPMKMLFSPLSAIFALYIAVVYGYLYLLFTSVPFIFKQYYGFSSTIVGLVYLGLGLGSFVGLGWYTGTTQRDLKKAIERDGPGSAKPEIRLKLLPVAAFIFPVGFFIYGWTADFHTHWMGPIAGLFVIGIGMYCNSFIAVQWFSLADVLGKVT